MTRPPETYTFENDFLPGADEEELTPAELAQAWQQEITELNHMLPPDSSARYTLDALSTTARTWTEEAQRVSDKEANDVPTTLQAKYDGYRSQAQRTGIAGGNMAVVGGASSNIEAEYPTAQMMDGTLSQYVPPNIFESAFASPFQRTPRQATVHRAHEETAATAQRNYNHHMNDFFDESVEPALARATAARPADTSKKIVETLAEQTDAKMSPTLDALREAIMRRRQVDVGSVAMRGRLDAERLVIEAANDLRNALRVPSLYTPELKAAVSETLRKTFGLPGEQQIADHMAELIGTARGNMTQRLLQQVAHIAAQYNKGVGWASMSTAPPEIPKYQQEVDAEITAMRKGGMADNKIHRRLMMKYHADSSEGDPSKAKYVSELITKTKPEQEYRN